MSDRWWHGAVIYQIYPRSFCDSNGDGVGDLQGIIGKLPYVASLGVDGIWLSPFFTSPMTDFGYDVADYRNVDPLFGSLADFDGLVTAAHRLGLKLVIDMVWSHSSEQHPWFVESRSTRAGPRADWYVWAEPRTDGTPPNNWLSVFGGGAWAWEPRRRQYYLHHFLPSQPKLNLRQPAVMQALLDIGAFWLERGVDGFRLDAVDFLAHDESLADNPPARHAATPIKPYHMQRHLHDLGGAQILPVIEQLRAFVDRYPQATMIAEVGSETTDTTSLARAASYVVNGGMGLHAAYSLAQMKSTGSAEVLSAAIREVERYFPEHGLYWAFSNHDVARVVTRWGDGSMASAKLFMALLLSLRGGAFVYQGEELGLPEVELSYEQLQDPYGRNYWPDFKGRDGCRTPMPWSSDGINAGFSTARHPWLPVGDNHRALAVERQEADPESMLQTCRRFLDWRRNRPALRHGALVPREAPEPIVAFERHAADERLLCVFNLSPDKIEFMLPNERLTPAYEIAATSAGPGIVLGGYGAYFAAVEKSA